MSSSVPSPPPTSSRIFLAPLFEPPLPLYLFFIFFISFLNIIVIPPLPMKLIGVPEFKPSHLQFFFSEGWSWNIPYWQITKYSLPYFFFLFLFLFGVFVCRFFVIVISSTRRMERSRVTKTYLLQHDISMKVMLFVVYIYRCNKSSRTYIQREFHTR